MVTKGGTEPWLAPVYVALGRGATMRLPARLAAEG